MARKLLAGPDECLYDFRCIVRTFTSWYRNLHRPAERFIKAGDKSRAPVGEGRPTLNKGHDVARGFTVRYFDDQMASVDPVTAFQLVRRLDGLRIHDGAIVACTIAYEPTVTIEFKSQMRTRQPGVVRISQLIINRAPETNSAVLQLKFPARSFRPRDRQFQHEKYTVASAAWNKPKWNG